MLEDASKDFGLYFQTLLRKLNFVCINILY